MRLALVVLAGCNGVLGLDPTTPLDAAADAAPPACHAGTPPVFSRKLHQLFVQPCDEFTPSPSADRAMGMCGEASGKRVPAIGPLAGQLKPIQIDLSTILLSSPRMFPEGDRFIASIIPSMMSGAGQVVIYENMNGTWVAGTRLGTEFLGVQILVGGPSRGPMSRVIRSTSQSDEVIIEELEEREPGAWSPVGQYSPEDLGLAPNTMILANLTGDALHMVFAYTSPSAPTGVYYAERASLTDRFSPAVRLDGVPSVGDAYMTDDCARVYFSGLGTSIFYAEQD